MLSEAKHLGREWERTQAHVAQILPLRCAAGQNDKLRLETVAQCISDPSRVSRMANYSRSAGRNLLLFGRSKR